MQASSTSVFTALETRAVSPDEGLTTLVDRKIVDSLALDNEIKQLFADTWSPGCLLLDYLHAAGGTELQVGPWLPSERGSTVTEPGFDKTGVRDVKLRVPITNVPFVKSTRMEVRYTISTGREGATEKLCIEVVSATPDVPYGTCFYTCAKICIESSYGGGVAITFSCWVNYIKDTRIRRAITLAFVVEQRKAVKDLMGVIQRHAEECTQSSSDTVPSPKVKSAAPLRRSVEPSCHPCQLIHQVRRSSSEIWRQRSSSALWRKASSSEICGERSPASSRTLGSDSPSSPAAASSPPAHAPPHKAFGTVQLPSVTAALLFVLILVVLLLILLAWCHDSRPFRLWHPIAMTAAFISLVAGQITPLTSSRFGPKLMFEGSSRG